MPNIQSAAMGVLMDWRDGRIRGWVEAPKEEKGGGESGGVRKEIVREWAEEFRIEGLWDDDEERVDEEVVMKE